MKLFNLTPLKRGELPLSKYQDIINARMRGVISTFKDSDGVIYYDQYDYLRYKSGQKKGRTLLGNFLLTVPAEAQLLVHAALDDPVSFSGTAADFKNLPEYHDYYSSRVLVRVLPIKTASNGQPVLLIYYT